MSKVLQVSATQFSRGFARYQDEAHVAGVIEITSHERVVGGYLSARELENYRRLKAKERDVIAFEEFDDEMLSDLKTTQWGKVSG